MQDGLSNKGLELIQPSSDGVTRIYPCDIVLKDGSTRARVAILVGGFGASGWAVGADREIVWNDVQYVHESPERLPARIANKLYEVGEAGMGYLLFWLEDASGRTARCYSGNVVDFGYVADAANDFDRTSIRRAEAVTNREQMDRFGTKSPPIGAPDYYIFLRQSDLMP
ncbi:MAG: hypothetical protein EP335_17755 [Alphaproteobacteria bacterium]|nr:MAG: hypothetical protein EP335_17755 [Alphaproteobacteria bacterium]